MRILAINPGSTSTKIAVYEDEKTLLNKDIAHSATELSRFHEVTDQYHFRRQLIIDELRREGIKLDFRAVIGRGFQFFTNVPNAPKDTYNPSDWGL